MSDKGAFYENFEAANKKLVEFQKIFDGSEIHRAGVIQAFEFTFEQCWKAIQKRAGQEGLSIASPKKALEWAMSTGWIPTNKEQIWLNLIKDRNFTSHTYREETAKDVTQRILDHYVLEFGLLLEKMTRG